MHRWDEADPPPRGEATPDMPESTEQRLAPCPGARNCVCSDVRDPRHAVAPLRPAGPPGEVWRAAVEAVRRLPRCRVITESDGYLHAEVKSAVFGFVDDLELQIRPAQEVIAVRSAARLGYHDFGVNRRRVERLRAQLAKRGWLLR